MSRSRIIIALMVMVLGLALALTGILFHKVTVTAKDGTEAGGAQPATTVMSEPQVNAQVSVGGLDRTESGEIVKTYEEKPPEACPT